MDVSKEKEAREQEKKKKGGYDMRLIDADALMRVIDAVPLTFDGGVDINELETIINEQPTIEERKTGEWIEAEVMPKTFDVNGIETWASKMQCDQCGFITYAIEGHMGQYNFCPNCGADMRGGNHETS